MISIAVSFERGIPPHRLPSKARARGGILTSKLLKGMRLQARRQFLSLTREEVPAGALILNKTEGNFMKRLLVLVTILMLAGCGDSIEWLPENETGTDSAAPDDFNFATKNNVALTTEIQSDLVTIKGNQAATWVISVSDATPDANSKYSINGAAFVSTAGTILPNQSLRIQHTSASTTSTIATTNVTIGTLTKTFQSQTTP